MNITVDIRQLLAAHHSIGCFYTIDDVRLERPHLNDRQAWQVLQAIDTSLETVPEYGMCYETIHHFADELFPLQETSSAYAGGQS